MLFQKSLDLLPKLQEAARMTSDYDFYWETLQKSHDKHPGNRYRYQSILKFVASKVPVGATLLDIGCGSGELLQRIKTLRPDLRLTGSDISQNAVSLASRRAVGDCFVADFSIGEVDPEMREKFDVIVLSEVIEHVENDAKLVRGVAKLLKPNGILYLSTQTGKRYRMDIEVLGHLRHYSRRAVEKLVIASGLSVTQVSQSGFPVLFFQKILVELFFDRVLTRVYSEQAPSLLQRFVMGSAYWAMRLLPLPLGPQLVLVAVKHD
jgi:2-polyprenyl-3-methyl-5-hydroxy-6-metoxy-1,4-benzoquinol methylase